MDDDLLAATFAARRRLVDAEHDADVARADYEHAVRRLYAAGANLREIAKALGLSHQRVHQIVESGAVRRRLRRRGSDPAVFACSFCGTAQAQTRKLVAGPKVFICDACIRLGGGVVAGRAPLGNDLVQLDLLTGPAGCSFCAKTTSQVAALVGTPDVSICSECLELCEEIMAEEGLD